MTKSIECNNVDTLYDIFSALSSKTRFSIVVKLLNSEECNVNKIVEELKVPQSTISQHLNVLKNAGIIAGFRNGTRIYYKVVSKQAINIINAIETNNY